MKRVLKNKKGFTLVELLAVIVVLAIIILIAVPSVMNSMEKARRNSFVVEAREIIKSAQAAYAEYLMNSSSGSGSTVCISYAALKSAGFIEKNDSTYKGSVKIEAKAGGESVYTIWLSNRAYIITGKTASGLKNEDATQSGDNNASENCNGMANVLTASAIGGQ